MKMNGSEIIVDMLIDEGVPYAIGIGGHGNLGLIDALRRRRDQIKVIMPRHEQAAVHMADGYYRVKSEPLMVFTSIGAGASNTAIGLATAYVDSIPLLLMIGETHVHMRGVGVLQEIERQFWSDMPRMLHPTVKRAWRIDSARQLPRAVAQAFNAMCTGRPGPTLIDLPMDVQVEDVELHALPKPQSRRPHDRPAGDPEAIKQAAQVLINAKRPVVIVGGGVTLSCAEAEVMALAEHLGLCVVSTMQGKGSFPEQHPLYAWHMGSNGTTCGNDMTKEADVVLAVGMRFADKATSSYRHGSTFSIPPTRLIHIDIDPFEIGKNYPVEVGIVGDAKAVLDGLVTAVREMTPTRHWKDSAYTKEISERVTGWWASNKELRESNNTPVTMGRVLTEVRSVLPPEAIVTSSSGNIQAQVFQEMAFDLPRTYLSAGGFSTMGWAYPAAMGAKLAAPDVPVVSMTGDGDFLMTIQEIATAVQYNIPVVGIVFNNQGWQAIRDLQMIAFGDEAAYATMFEETGGKPVTPHIADAAKAFGAHAVRISRPDEVAPALEEALNLNRPAVIEVMIDANFGTSGGQAPGWWDVPVPGYLGKRRNIYDQERKDERV